MEYLKWNDVLTEYFFNSAMSMREVLLYVNDEIINEIGQPYDVGVNDFIESVKRGPRWITESRLCEKAFQAFNHWRNRGLAYPPYVSYLVFFVLAAVTETEYAPHSYYPGLRKLLGVSQHSGTFFGFDNMRLLWHDLEKWSQEDKHQELGRFVARIRGGKIHVGMPRSQTVLSENERKQLPNIFSQAGLDPTDPPSPEIIPKLLSHYGQTFLEKRTKNLLESRQASDRVLKRALTELVLDELEVWDGTTPELIEENESTLSQQVNTSLRLCIKIDSLASQVETYLRLKTSKPFPEEGLHFMFNDHVWDCRESQHGWSTPLKDYTESPPKLLNGYNISWIAGVRLVDNLFNWRTGLPGKEVRLFRIGIDGLPDWVETQRLERRIEFLVTCREHLGRKIGEWGKINCEKFEQKYVTGLPSGWLLYQGKNAIESCPNIDVLTLSTFLRLHLKDGIKADKGNVYFKFAPPNIVLENNQGTERVLVDNQPCQQPNKDLPIYILPENLPSNLPVRIEVESGDHRLSKVVWLREFDLPESFSDEVVRNPEGEICSKGTSAYAHGAHVIDELPQTIQHIPDLVSLSSKVVLIGEKPGEIVVWPNESYPQNWQPIWAFTRVNNKRYKVYYCGTHDELKRITSLPDPVGKAVDVKHWKEFVWYKRKRIIPPKMVTIRLLWHNYIKLAKNV